MMPPRPHTRPPLPRRRRCHKDAEVRRPDSAELPAPTALNDLLPLSRAIRQRPDAIVAGPPLSRYGCILMARPLWPISLRQFTPAGCRRFRHASIAAEATEAAFSLLRHADAFSPAAPFQFSRRLAILMISTFRADFTSSSPLLRLMLL
jgi:hypothetical protein